MWALSPRWSEPRATEFSKWSGKVRGTIRPIDQRRRLLEPFVRNNHSRRWLVDGDELWGRAYADLMARAEARLIQEIARLAGDFAHIFDEAIEPKHDAATGESFLPGRFTYMLYRGPPAIA